MSDCPRCGAPLDSGIPGTDRMRCAFCGSVHPSSGRLLLMPDFRDPNLASWRLPPAGRYEHRPASGELVLLCAPPDDTLTDMEAAFTLDDVEVGVTMRIGPGVEAIAGVDLRKGSAGSYDFRLTGNGSFMAKRYSPGGEGEWLVDPTSHPALRTPMTGPNRLALLAQGERIRVFLNGQLAASFRDTTLRRGSIRMSAFCKEEPAAVTFSDLTLYEPEEESA